MPNPNNAIFTPPTSNTDGSAIAPGEIVKYTLAVGLKVASGVQTFPTTFDDVDVTPNVDGTISVPLASLGVLVPGIYAGVVKAVTAGGVSSAPSTQANFTLAPIIITPNPPTALTFA